MKIILLMLLLPLGVFCQDRVGGTISEVEEVVDLKQKVETMYQIVQTAKRAELIAKEQVIAEKVKIGVVKKMNFSLAEQVRQCDYDRSEISMRYTKTKKVSTVKSIVIVALMAGIAVISVK